MRLLHLSLTDYRLFNRLDIDIPRPAILLVGDNAQGKTSLLEAIFFLATYSSYQASHDRQLINFSAAEKALSVARLVAEYETSGKNQRMEVRIIQEANGNGTRVRKEILIGGVKRKVHEALGEFNAVIFLPQMMSLISGSPDERRRYLNLAIVQALPGFGLALTEYNQALAQRNALLKNLAERNGDPTQLDFWDEILARKGASIIRARSMAVESLELLAAQYHKRLSHEQEVLRMVYKPSHDPLYQPGDQITLPIDVSPLRSAITEDRLFTGFLQRLMTTRNEDIFRGVTTIGPHRDEVRFLVNGIDLGDYGSRGQVRSAILSLKLAEVAWLRDKTGQWPVLLLDEILAELDHQRREDLLAVLENSDQVFMTTTDLNAFSKSFVEKNHVWTIHNGLVSVQGKPVRVE